MDLNITNKIMKLNKVHKFFNIQKNKNKKLQI